METFFPYRLALTAETFARQLVAVYGRAFGLSREEWRLLFLLDGGGTLNSLTLSQVTSLDKVQISRASSRLEAKGLLTRSVRGSDRRLRDFTITEAGRALFAEAFAAVDARAEALLGRLAPDDRAALIRGIDALEAALRAERDAARAARDSCN